MNDAPDHPLTAEEIRFIARVQLGLALTDREVEALRPVLNGLLDEIHRITPADRAGAEPDFACTLEVWNR
jgi:hypothetical protein